MSSFVSLHNHTYFSILHSLISPKDLILKAKELGQSAIGVSDYGTMAGVWDCYKVSKQTGVKLIVGCEFYFTDDITNKSNKFRYVVLLAKNAIGYKNILLLNRIGYENSSIVLKRVVPVIDWKMLEKHSDGVICLTGCGNGIFAQSLNDKNFEQAERILLRLKSIFGESLGAEIQTHNLIRNETHHLGATNQNFVNTHTIRIADKLGIRIVPTTNAHYIKKDDADVFDTTLAIASMQPVYSNARIKYGVSDFYMKTEEQVKAFFSRNYSSEFAEKIIANTTYFADLCENPDWIDPKFSNPNGKELPVFPIKDEKDYKQFLVWKSMQSAERRKLEDDKLFLRFRCEKYGADKIPADKKELYQKRLEEELDVFYYCGSASYMLIAADYIEWARQNGATLSPGRGSVGCSLVAYILNIHFADPIKYGLPFERFYSKLRTSFADIDADFLKARRDDVIQYIVKKYGKENVAQITNNIYITPKVYVRDLARACDLAGDRLLSVKLGTDIADIVPKKDMYGNEVRTYKDIIKNSPLFVEYIKRYPKLEKNSDICGKPRSAGLHAAGIVIGQRPLSEIVPTRVDKDGIVSVQFDKDRAEEAGLVKMDILGIESLDIIEETNKLIRAGGKEVPVIDYEGYDQKTYDLISRGDTFCVFQFGQSGGTIDLCKRIKPKCMEDLALITCIARPASKAIRDDIIKTREGKMKPKLLHPKLENALKRTFGYPIYDETLQIIARDIAGWDLAEADKLRKLTKEKGKNPEKAEQWRQDFIQGAVKNKVSREKAIEIWSQLIEPFSAYSFNCSHAVVYSMLSYHTAFLKAHFPIEFLLANLMYEIRSNVKQAKENIEKIKNELKKNGIKIIPPNINSSPFTYEVKDNTLLTGLDALKFVGDNAIADIIAKRPFKSFDDFIQRVDTHAVRANTIQALAASGALDCFQIPRKLMYLYCTDYRKKFQVWCKKHDPTIESFVYPWPVEKEWTNPELYALEKKYLGEAFICGKEEAYPGFFSSKNYPIKLLKQLNDKEKVSPIKAEVKSVFEFKVKKETSKYIGQDMIKATIEDQFGDSMTLTVFSKNWKDVKQKIKDQSRGKAKFEEGVVISFAGTVNEYEDEKNLILDELYGFLPAPSPPKDLKTKKIVMRKKKSDGSDSESLNIDDTLSAVEKFEDDLFNEGHIDLDDENIEDEDI
jgi:DNA polymerase-3 subunit alpha